MKTLLLLLLLSLSAFAHEEHDWRTDMGAYLAVQYEIPFATHFKTRKNVVPLDMTFFREKLLILTGEKDFRGQVIQERKSQDQLDIARAFLREEYEALGFTVSIHEFGSGKNFVAEKRGTLTPEKVLVLSSHIDSVGNKWANDNGTGTIGLLTVARELAKKNYGSTIRILGFDREEVGLKGSDAYVAAISDKKKIIGNINFEMMGVHKRNDGAFHVIDCDRSDSLFLSQEIKTALVNHNLPLIVAKTCTDRSDHASFWRFNIPAVVISENFFGGDADPCYHKKCDVVDDRLNYDYMENILTAVMLAAENLAR